MVSYRACQISMVAYRKCWECRSCGSLIRARELRQLTQSLVRLLQPGQKGVLLRRIEPTLPVCKQLRKGDVMLSFDGTQIGNDGTVAFRSGERINFSYLVSEKQNHEDVRLQTRTYAYQHMIPSTRQSQIVGNSGTRWKLLHSQTVCIAFTSTFWRGCCVMSQAHL